MVPTQRRRLPVLAPLILIVLTASAVSHAAEFRVGAGGTHATIQSAVAAAQAAPGNHIIKIRTGVYGENVGLWAPFTGSLEMVGGWDATFATRTRDASATVIDGQALGRVLLLRAEGGSLLVEGLTLRNGRLALEDGAGLYVEASAHSSVRVSNCHIRDNHVGPKHPWAAGAHVTLLDGSTFALSDSRIQGNTAAVSTGNALGIGLLVSAYDRTEAVIRRNLFVSNVSRLETAGGTNGAALYAGAVTGARIEISENRFEGNAVELTPGPPALDATAGIFLYGDGSDGSFVVRRNRFVGNRGGYAVQLLGDRPIELTDNLLVGNSRGILCYPCGPFHLTNLTLVDSGGIRLEQSASTEVSIANSIVFGVGAGIISTPGFPPPTLFNNLVGTDPSFVNPAAGDYRLLPGSLGIDAGEDSPPGGLGPLDLLNDRRRRGSHVDLGAFEFSGSDSATGGGLCLVGDRPVAPVFTNACRCARDAGLNEARCGFLLPELFLEAVAGIPAIPGAPTDQRWVIHPWQGSAGPYEIAVEALQNGKWIALVPSELPAGTLSIDKLVQHTFSPAGLASDLPMRARIRHMAPKTPGSPDLTMVEDFVYWAMTK